MQRGEEPQVDDAIKEIGALLAAAYRRRAKIRLIPPEPPSIPALANSGEPSVHELTLTRRREEANGDE